LNVVKLSPILFGLSLAVVGSSLTAAQDATSTSLVPHVLQITREYTKPHKSGAAHDKTESAFVDANRQAKFPVNYVEMNSMTGNARSLYLTRYSSFEDWEKANALMATSRLPQKSSAQASPMGNSLRRSIPPYIHWTTNSVSTLTATFKTTASISLRLSHPPRTREGMARAREIGQGCP
jgi:hypothetical protein